MYAMRLLIIDISMQKMRMRKPTFQPLWCCRDWQTLIVEWLMIDEVSSIDWFPSIDVNISSDELFTRSIFAMTFIDAVSWLFHDDITPILSFRDDYFHYDVTFYHFIIITRESRHYDMRLRNTCSPRHYEFSLLLLRRRVIIICHLLLDDTHYDDIIATHLWWKHFEPL